MKENRTVFMIDDDIDDQELFAEALSDVDQSIKCVKPFNGRQALRLLSEEAAVLPEFIFVDLNMPVMNGYEFLKEIKKDEHLNHIPVIMYTTSSEAKDREEAIKLGALSFITKPSDIGELRKKLEAILLMHSPAMNF